MINHDNGKTLVMVEYSPPRRESRFTKREPCQHRRSSWRTETDSRRGRRRVRRCENAQCKRALEWTEWVRG